MIYSSVSFWGLIIAILLTWLLFIFIQKLKVQKQLKISFTCLLICLLICSTGLLLQLIFANYFNIPAIYFDYYVYIGTCFLPVSFLFTALIFAKTKIIFRKYHYLLFAIPILSLIILWSNDFHNLFYVEYSTNIKETIFGPYFTFHSIYSYLCIGMGLINLIYYSIKNSGFFSKQSILIYLGAIVCSGLNLLGTFGILDLSIYVTPISFSIAVVFWSFAIFKFDFLKVAPIALQRIVDRISDAYIVINDDNIISDFNQTLLDMFNVKSSDIRNKKLSTLFTSYENFKLDSDLILSYVENSKKTSDTIILEAYFNKINKYFHIEINSITNEGSFLGTLILFKDITQHTLDMQTIQDNQDMLIEKERLASLGQMIGGIAHNLKTPIMSIAGATEGLSDLIKEYDFSIEDPDVNFQDHHEIARDMNEWIGKIRTHLSYMSDIITAIKGQAVNFSDQSSTAFSIRELINYVDILMKHELKNALINLKTQADIDTSTILNGNINSLVQVINNIISNAIQAYQAQGKTNYDINFNIYKEDSNIIFKIEDFAGGLPDKVTKKLFKEMVTTKRKKRNRTWFVYVIFKYKSSF